MKPKVSVTVITSTLLLLALCAFARGARQDIDARLATFQAGLDQQGFEVTPGVAKAFDLLGDWCDGKTDDAQCVNSGLYLMVNVPESSPEGQNPTRFKIRHDEAIVLIGRTPPPAKYFGFYAFVATRFYPDKEKGNERTEIVSTLGDAVNHATIKTTGPTPFDSPIALIFTPDQGTDAGIRSALRRAGYPEAIINTYVLPASMLNLGHGKTADELQITLRTALFEVPTAGDSYMRGAAADLHILRVTPHTPAAADPFPTPRLRVRGTGESEMRLMNKLGELRAGIIEANPGLFATDFLSSSEAAAYEDYELPATRNQGSGRQQGWILPVRRLDDALVLCERRHHAGR